MVFVQSQGVVNDITEGINKGLRFCAQRVTADLVLDLYPRMRLTNDPIDNQRGT